MVPTIAQSYGIEQRIFQRMGGRNDGKTLNEP